MWLTYGMSEVGIQLNSLMWEEPARRGSHHSLCKDAELYEWRNRAKGKQTTNQERIHTFLSALAYGCDYLSLQVPDTATFSQSWTVMGKGSGS